MLITNGTLIIPVEYLEGRSPSEYTALTVSGGDLYPLYQDQDILLVYKTDSYPVQTAIVFSDGLFLLGGVGEDRVFTPFNTKHPPITDFCIIGVPTLLIRKFS